MYKRPTILSRNKLKNQRFPQQTPDHYECGACSTVFREEDLEFDLHHGELLGKHTYKPEAIECPFCGAKVKHNNPQTVKLEPIRKQNGTREKCDMFPRTVTQNCLSATQAIKPQIDWDLFNTWVFHHGLPCPVPTVQTLESIRVK
jgi:DNA-directed RNA polymerase subunit RPC12/RpoP